MSNAWRAGLVLGIVAAAAPGRADEWSRQYPLKGRPELHVTTDDGSVRIEASDRPQIEARVETVGWAIAPDGVTVSESQTGDRVDIEVRLPHRQWDFGIHHRSVKVTLRVPRAADLEVRTGDGASRWSPSPAASGSRPATGASPPTGCRATCACTPGTGRSGPPAWTDGWKPTPGTDT